MSYVPITTNICYQFDHFSLHINAFQALFLGPTPTHRSTYIFARVVRIVARAR
jgi:hypothetical protein